MLRCVYSCMRNIAASVYFSFTQIKPFYQFFCLNENQEINAVENKCVYECVSVWVCVRGWWRCFIFHPTDSSFSLVDFVTMLKNWNAANVCLNQPNSSRVFHFFRVDFFFNHVFFLIFFLWRRFICICTYMLLARNTFLLLPARWRLMPFYAPCHLIRVPLFFYFCRYTLWYMYKTYKFRNIEWLF